MAVYQVGSRRIQKFSGKRSEDLYELTLIVLDISSPVMDG